MYNILTVTDYTGAYVTCDSINVSSTDSGVSLKALVGSGAFFVNKNTFLQKCVNVIILLTFW